MPERHFPSPRSVEEMDARIIVRDANGLPLAAGPAPVSNRR
jgi:hypothetical protein